MLPLAVLLVSLLPSPASAGCSPSDAPQGYGASWWSSYKSWCRGCGGQVSDSHSTATDCRLPASSGASSGGVSPGASVGQAIGQGVVDLYRIQAAQHKARMEQLRLEQLRLEELRRQQEAARKAKFDKDKNALLDKMGGGPKPLGLKDDEVEPAQPDMGAVRDLHNKEAAQRREALERLKGKPEELWCKLHLPQALLLPEPPIEDVADRYPAMMSAFVQNRSEWDRRCGGPSAAGVTEFDTAVSLLTRQAPKPEVPEAPPAKPAAPSGRLELKE
ncbi:hypothetical protein EPO15_10975 [bacterium]|nr:MAG: hypothetical protein EPO15_10975 [bacterium]